MAHNNPQSTERITQVAISEIDPVRRSWHRKYEDPAASERLRAAIRASGNIEQPVLLRPTTSDSEFSYEVVFGQGRLEVAIAEGLTSVPARMRKVSDAEAMKLAAQENGTHAGKGRLLTRAWRAASYRAAVSSNGQMLDKELGADLGEDPSEISELLQFAEAVSEEKVVALVKKWEVSLHDVVRITRAALRAIVKLPSAQQREAEVTRFVRHLAEHGKPHEASDAVIKACRRSLEQSADPTSDQNGGDKSAQRHTAASANGSASATEHEHTQLNEGAVSGSALLEFAARIREADFDGLTDEEVLLFVSRFGPTYRTLQQRYRDVLERLLDGSRTNQVRHANFLSRSWSRFVRLLRS